MKRGRGGEREWGRCGERERCRERLGDKGGMSGECGRGGERGKKVAERVG